MTKIIGIGNALVDILVHLEDERRLEALQLPKGGMTHIDRTRYDELLAALQTLPHEIATGGSAANTIHALALLGNEVGLVGTVGNDELGAFFTKSACKRGIDARVRMAAEGDTGVATTFISANGERTFATYLGVAPDIVFEPQPDFIGKDAILHVEGYLVQNHAFIEQVMRTAKELGMCVSYDLASWNIVQTDRDFVRHLVEEYVDIAFANEEEAAAFSGQDDPAEALRLLAAMTDTAIVKIGKRGALGQRGEDVSTVAGCDVHAIDTTAAGDFFAAGFLHGRVRGWSLEQSLDLGNRTAAEVVQVIGTQVSRERMRANLKY
jgi:sugar/nucleoside kinase (ribokinase family)